MKLKKYIYALGLSVALVISSCQKVLEVEPIYVKDGSQIYTSLTDYEYALTGAYSLLRQTGYYGNGAQTTGAWSTLPDMMAEDLLQTSEDLANFATLTNYGFVTSEDDVLVSWLAAYRVISQANLVLRNIEQFSTSALKKVNRLKGQALALRAMVHFDLLRYWGVDYERNSTNLGIPYVTTVDVELKPARLTVKETYDKIFADLISAESLLGDVDIAINTSARAYIDQAVVRALLARVNLYAKDYAAAENYASLVISAFPLANAATFPSIWKDASTTEVIWSAIFSNPTEGSPAVNLYIASTNRNRYRPTAVFESLFTDKAADVRYSTYVSTRVLGANERKIVNKYVGKGTNSDNVVNWKAFRTGEMYLIRAEARANQTGKEALALTDLNTLRAARISNYVPEALTGSALINAIFVERRKELFAEGHRFFDLKRTTRVVTRTDNVGAAPGFQASLPANSRVWVFPIPQSEIDANPNIRGQQSPGWN